jgi:hypothetical protein
MEPTETATTPNSAETPVVEAVAAAATLLSDATAAAAVVIPPVAEPVATPAESAEAKPEVKVEGAPETYAFVAPEGQTYDANILTAFEASAKEANLTQDAAQKLLDSMAPKIAERQTEQVLAINKEWLDSSKSDKEFGGDALDANLGIAKKALDTFGSPELSKLLGTTGLGNHPEVIRAFYKIGKAISEDTFVSGAAPTGKPVSAASILYGTTP